MRLEPLEPLYASLPLEGRRRLESYLTMITGGQPQDYLTPFFPKDWRGKDLEYGQYILKRFGDTRYPELNEYEAGAATKFGPFSVRLPFNDRIEGVEKYFSQESKVPPPEMPRAVKSVQGLMPKSSLRTLPLTISYAALPPGTNLGLPYFSREKKWKVDYLERANYIRDTGWKQDLFPATLGWRGQPTGTPLSKQRVVWMVDHVETVVGLSVQRPVLGKLRHLPGYSAWNDAATVDRAITRMIDRAKSDIMSVDFSGYDASIPGYLIHAVFDVLRYWFVKEDWKLLDWLERNSIEMGLACPDGIRTGREGGVASGLSTTNLIDTLGQQILWSCEDEAIWNEGEYLGDDGCIPLKPGADPEQISVRARQRFGVKVSADKGGLSKDHVFFLQRIHMRDYRIHGLCPGVRTACRTWNGVIHMERLHKDLPPEFFSCRCIMQLEQMKHHPNFRSVVVYAYEQDKFMREMDASDIFRAAGGASKVETVLGLKSFRVDEELPSQGLDKFESVKLLRELRGSGRKGQDVA